jgi:hypothetical protein
MDKETFSEFGGEDDREREEILKRLDSLKEPVTGDSEEAYQQTLKRFDNSIAQSAPPSKPSAGKLFLDAVRWIIFLPAAFATLILVDLFFNFFAMSFWDAPFIEEPIKGGMTAIAALMVGFKIAPRQNNWVTRSISIPLLILMIMSALGDILRPKGDEDMAWLRAGAAAFFFLLGAIFPDIFAKKKNLR